jgi:hypothetical protein
MEEPYDLMGGVLSTKANEQMIGFAGFVKPDREGGAPLEGMVKVSAFHRADGSGYLTLTFIIDQEPGGVAGEPRRRLGKPDPDDLRKRLGSNFEMLIDLPLSPLSNASPFFIEEFDVYFRHLQGQEQSLAETTLLPALGDLLGLRFEPLNPWQSEQESPLSRLLAEAEARVARPPEPKSLLKRLFGRAG